ncbi:MAG: hypothetical protein QOF73_3529, partial [Thermomicrobiales bacterium]|nr:hypothetical protein [Thermomicrobiales bacterium]
DPSNGKLVLSVVTPKGRDLVRAATIAVPFEVRMVTHGAKELQQIQDDATFLAAQGVPDADLIYQTLPDERDNRALLVIRSMSQELLDALAKRYPADAVAVQVKPTRGP